MDAAQLIIELICAAIFGGAAVAVARAPRGRERTLIATGIAAMLLCLMLGIGLGMVLDAEHPPCGAAGPQRSQTLPLR